MNSFKYLLSKTFVPGFLVGNCISLVIGLLTYVVYEFGNKPHGLSISNELLAILVTIVLGLFFGFLIGGLSCST